MTTKLPCELGCSSSDAMVEYDNAYKCFSCGRYKPKKRGLVQNTARFGVRSRPNSLPVRDSIYTERDFIGYLQALGLDNLETHWSDKYQALGIGLYFLSNKVGTAYRTTLDSKAKSKWLTFYNDGVKQLSSFGGYTEEAWITEDLLSAAKLNKLTQQLAICISGTKLSDLMLLTLVKLNFKTIYLCLDPDDAGQDAAKVIQKRLSLYTNCVNLVFSRGPKYASLEEVNKVKHEQLKH